MSLIPFLNRHSGETAWLFGKGPSLVTFDFQTAGPLRVAINDVIQYVPKCTYGFSNDGVAKWRDVYKPEHTIFQPIRAIYEFDSRNGAIPCQVVIYEDIHDDSRMALSREEIARKPAIRRGTLGSALQILHVMGVRTIHLVGIDGGGTHADGFEWRTRIRNGQARNYNAIRNAAIDAANIMGLTLKFHNEENTMETNGKIFVRFLNNAFANAEPYCQGEIASFNPRIAAELVAARAAEYFTPPSKQPEIEQAIAPMIERESAMIATKKAKKLR